MSAPPPTPDILPKPHRERSAPLAAPSKLNTNQTAEILRYHLLVPLIGVVGALSGLLATHIEDADAGGEAASPTLAEIQKVGRTRARRRNIAGAHLPPLDLSHADPDPGDRHGRIDSRAPPRAAARVQSRRAAD